MFQSVSLIIERCLIKHSVCYNMIMIFRTDWLMICTRLLPSVPIQNNNELELIVVFFYTGWFIIYDLMSYFFCQIHTFEKILGSESFTRWLKREGP